MVFSRAVVLIIKRFQEKNDDNMMINDFTWWSSYDDYFFALFRAVAVKHSEIKRPWLRRRFDDLF